jgi:hypothetical protein
MTPYYILDFDLGPQDPANTIPTIPLIARILTYLHSLPTSPSHPCSGSIYSALKSAKEGYVTSRRDYVATKCIGPIVKEFDHLADGPMSPGREEEGRKEKCKLIVRVVEGTLALMQVRRDVVSYSHHLCLGLELLSIE